jgi:alpha(1,3/1,4) fucosyltransferase
MIDIFGQGWPNGISRENSRFHQRRERKKDILDNYNFNLCFENTVFPKYITEKIWESIESNCLPIYYGCSKSSIYEIFPDKSFIDYSEFKVPEELIQFIENISQKEFRDRMNKCIKVYNSFIKKSESFWESERIRLLDNIIEKCNLILKK